MNKKFELLREAVNTYKVNHCDGNKNEKELLEFIDELEQLTIPVVLKSNCDKVDLSLVLSEYHKYILENGYTRNYIDTNLVAFEFMGMDYDDQKISKN